MQKSKKIFDPADHDQPARKRKTSDSTGTSPVNNQSAFTSTSVTIPVLSPRSSQGMRQPNVGTSPSSRGAAVTPKLYVSHASQVSGNSLKSIAIKRENACMYCGLDTPKQRAGRVEHLLKCKDCINIGKLFIISRDVGVSGRAVVASLPMLYNNEYTFIFSVHPSCMDYSEELTRKIMSMPWQCTNCKTCFFCKQANDDVSSIYL